MAPVRIDQRSTVGLRLLIGALTSACITEDVRIDQGCMVGLRLLVRLEDDAAFSDLAVVRIDQGNMVGLRFDAENLHERRVTQLVRIDQSSTVGLRLDELVELGGRVGGTRSE